jgi:hypothetical protein
MEEWEQSNGFEGVDMNTHERLKRYLMGVQDTKKNVRKAAKIVESLQAIHDATNNKPAVFNTFKAGRVDPYPQDLILQSYESSQEASDMFHSSMHFRVSKIALLENDTIGAIQSVAAALRLSDLMVKWTLPEAAHFAGLSSARLNEAPDDADAVLVTAFFLLMHREFDIGVELLSHPILAGDVSIANARGTIWTFAGHYAEAIQDFDIVLALGDINDVKVYSALYQRGHCKMQVGDKEGSKMDLYAFIERCKGNERLLCEAYFHLVFVDQVTPMRELYLKGMEALKKRCPIFINIASSNYQITAESFAAILPRHQCAN